MNTLRPDADLRTLGGLELEQVCIGRFQIQLRFSQRTVIAFEAVGTLEPGAIVLAPPSAAARELCELLGRRIDRVSLSVSEDLIVQFDSGEILKVPNDTVNLESFEILVANQRL